MNHEDIPKDVLLPIKAVCDVLARSCSWHLQGTVVQISSLVAHAV